MVFLINLDLSFEIVSFRSSNSDKKNKQLQTSVTEFLILRIFFHREKMGERYNIHSQLEHLQSKYIGTGHGDTTKFEWATNQHRDSYASYMGHFDLMNHFAIAENESKARVR